MSDRVRGGASAANAGVEIFVGFDVDGAALDDGVVELVIGNADDAFSVTGAPEELWRIVGTAAEALNAAGASNPVGVKPTQIAATASDADDLDDELPVSWQELATDGERAAWQKFFDTNTTGKAIALAANGDRDFAMWLTATYACHWKEALRELGEMNSARWRARYDIGWSPKAAVSAETAPPMILVENRLMCPHCGAIDRVAELCATWRNAVGEDAAADVTTNGAQPVCWRCNACTGLVTRTQPAH